MRLNSRITPVILTKNEEHNIGKCLDKLFWAKRVLVFDSYSTDKTKKIIQKYNNAVIINCKKNFDYVDKLNFICQETKKKFILLLDADYELSKGLIKKLSKFSPNKKIKGYKFIIFNKINGTLLKENLYPNKILLFWSKPNLFSKFGHKEIISYNSKIKLINNFIIHHDKKPFRFWRKNQINYAKKDAQEILEKNFNNLTLQNKIRRIPFLMNFVSLIYYMIFKNLIKYGYSGILYVLGRQFYEIILSYFLLKSVFKKYISI